MYKKNILVIRVLNPRTIALDLCLVYYVYNYTTQQINFQTIPFALTMSGGPSTLNAAHYILYLPILTIAVLTKKRIQCMYVYNTYYIVHKYMPPAAVYIYT